LTSTARLLLQKGLSALSKADTINFNHEAIPFFSSFRSSLSRHAARSGNYPPTKTVDASDTYFGKTYNDPYRWLENLKGADVEAWFKAQAELTDGLLAKAIPARDALVQEWLAVDESSETARLLVNPL